MPAAAASRRKLSSHASKLPPHGTAACAGTVASMQAMARTRTRTRPMVTSQSPAQYGLRPIAPYTLPARDRYAAVGDDHLAGDVARRRRRQKRGDAADLLGRAEPAQRGACVARRVSGDA